MVNYYLIDAFIITMLVMIALIFVWFVYRRISLFKLNTKYRKQEQERRFETIWNDIENIKDIHRSDFQYLNKERLDLIARVATLEEQIKNKEGKKNVKKKKRN